MKTSELCIKLSKFSEDLGTFSLAIEDMIQPLEEINEKLLDVETCFENLKEKVSEPRLKTLQNHLQKIDKMVEKILNGTYLAIDKLNK